jgi:hypothetical protein
LEEVSQDDQDSNKLFVEQNDMTASFIERAEKKRKRKKRKRKRKKQKKQVHKQGGVTINHSNAHLAIRL